MPIKSKFIQSILILFFLINFFSVNITNAQVIPLPEEGDFECKTDTETDFKNTIHKLESESEAGKYLSCKIMTGTFNVFDIPFYLKYIADFLLGIVGLISTLFIVIGGYNYIIGGISEDKEKGKNTIKHAIIGMIIALLSWAIVNTVISLVTS